MESWGNIFFLDESNRDLTAVWNMLTSNNALWIYLCVIAHVVAFFIFVKLGLLLSLRLMNFLLKIKRKLANSDIKNILIKCLKKGCIRWIIIIIVKSVAIWAIHGTETLTLYRIFLANIPFSNHNLLRDIYGEEFVLAYSEQVAISVQQLTTRISSWGLIGGFIYDVCDGVYNTADPVDNINSKESPIKSVMMSNRGNNHIDDIPVDPELYRNWPPRTPAPERGPSPPVHYPEPSPPERESSVPVNQPSPPEREPLVPVNEPSPRRGPSSPSVELVPSVVGHLAVDPPSPKNKDLSSIRSPRIQDLPPRVDELFPQQREEAQEQPSYEEVFRLANRAVEQGGPDAILRSQRAAALRAAQEETAQRLLDIESRDIPTKLTFRANNLLLRDRNAKHLADKNIFQDIFGDKNFTDREKNILFERARLGMATNNIIDMDRFDSLFYDRNEERYKNFKMTNTLRDKLKNGDFIVCKNTSRGSTWSSVKNNKEGLNFIYSLPKR